METIEHPTTPPPAGDGPQSEPPHEESKPQRPGFSVALRFVGIFLFTVFALLLAYRYSADSHTNRVYLDTVAKNTSWVLDKLGHSSTVITGHENGPLVMFVAKPTVQMQLDEAQRALTDLEAQSPAPSQARIDALKERIAELSKTEAAQKDTPPEERRKSGAAFAFTIVSECGAVEILAIYLAALLAFPTTWKKRAIGIVFGLPLLYAVNIFRLVCLGFIGAYTHGGEWFDLAHHYVWQGIYLVFVVAVWMVWVEFIVRKGDA